MPDMGVIDPSVLFLVRVAAEEFIRENPIDFLSLVFYFEFISQATHGAI
jgi:hypothetical protein